MKSIWIAAAIGMIAALPALAADDDEPPEYRDRGEARDAYRRGYERGFERGFQKGLAEGQRRPVVVPPPSRRRFGWGRSR